jgi:hypothetical protein
LRFSPSCNCCDFACQLASDDFERDEGTDLGIHWTESSGDGVIASHNLFTSSANARFLWNTPHPDEIAAHVVSVAVKGNASGDKARVILAHDADTGNELAVELTFGSASVGCGTFKLYENGVEIHSIPAIHVPCNMWATITACYLEEQFDSGGVLWASYTASNGTQRIITSYATATGTQVGLGTGSVASGVSFDNFVWFDMQTDDEDYDNPDEECSSCFWCDIWEATRSQNSLCDQTVSGDAFNYDNLSSWTVASLVQASDYDEANDFGVSLRFGLASTGLPPSGSMVVTLTLGSYTATFTAVVGPPFEYDITLTGPGVSASDTVPAPAFGTAREFHLSYMSGRLCASVDGSGSVQASPPGAVGTTASASSTKGGIESLVFTRCPECASNCGCGVNLPSTFAVTLAGFSGSGPGQCNNCPAMHGTHIVSFDSEFQRIEFESGSLVNTCLYIGSPVLLGTGLFCDPNGYRVRLTINKDVATGAYYIAVYTTVFNGTAQGRFRRVLTGTLDCTSFNNLDLPKLSPLGTHCVWNGPSASCKLTSV